MQKNDKTTAQGAPYFATGLAIGTAGLHFHRSRGAVTIIKDGARVATGPVADIQHWLRREGHVGDWPTGAQSGAQNAVALALVADADAKEKWAEAGRPRFRSAAIDPPAWLWARAMYHAALLRQSGALVQGEAFPTVKCFDPARWGALYALASWSR